MNPSVSPTDDVHDDDSLEQLRQLGEELRALFADERDAISRLDHERLEQLAAHKILLATQLAQLRGQLSESLERSPSVLALFIAIRVEARATAMLAAAATQAVHGLLGYEPAGRYDRRARPQTLTPSRLNVTY